MTANVSPRKDKPKTPSEWYTVIQQKRKVLLVGDDSTQLPQQVRAVLEFYTQAIQSIDFTSYLNDFYLVAIWLEFIQLQRKMNADDKVVSKFYEKMQALGIGSEIAQFYTQWAEFEAQKDKQRAIDILMCGEKKNARPLTSITLMLSKLTGKENLMPKSSKYADIDDDLPEPPILSIDLPPGPAKPRVRFTPSTKAEVAETPDVPTVAKQVEEIALKHVPRKPLEPVSDRVEVAAQQIEQKNAVSVPKETPKPVIIQPKATPRVLAPQDPSPVEEEKPADMTISYTADLTQQSAPKPQPTPMSASKRNTITVNGHSYLRLEMVGRGGSSRVFKVLQLPNYKILALKCVKLRGLDQVTMKGYLNEIELLKKLSGCDRIIQLYESELNKREGMLYMLMECGEIDLAGVLQKQQLNMNFIRVYWEQMLTAVHNIHEARVVHSDLKPANFLFVRGGLKLIDFGIAKAIQNDTTNIHRENQVGTVNYMSPEAIIDINSLKNPNSNEPKCMKLGRASDVWSLGCILYQMVYQKTPFAHLAMAVKLHAIVDPKQAIEFPPVDNPFLLDTMKSCLRRDPKQRLTIPELLQHPFLHPDAFMKTSSIFSDELVERMVDMSIEQKTAHPDWTSTQLAKQVQTQIIRETFHK